MAYTMVLGLGGEMSHHKPCGPWYRCWMRRPYFITKTPHAQAIFLEYVKGPSCGYVVATHVRALMLTLREKELIEDALSGQLALVPASDVYYLLDTNGEARPFRPLG